MTTVRPKSSANKTSSLPGLNRSKPKKTVAEELRDLKLKIQQMQQEKVQLKSRTTRMRQTLADRNKAIDNVFKEQVTEKQKIQTASESTLAQLKESVASLENTLKSRQEELKRLTQTDRLAQSDELKEEVKVMYLEHQRLLKQNKAVKEGEGIVGAELSRVKNELNERRVNKQGIANLQNDLSDIVDKIVSYKKSGIKIETDELAKYLAENPKKAETKEKELNEELDCLENEIDKLHNEISEAEDNEEDMINKLQNVIDEQSTKISEQIERLQEEKRQHDEEEESKEKSNRNRNHHSSYKEESSEYRPNTKENSLSESSIHEADAEEAPKEEKKEKASTLVLGEKAPRSETFMTNDGASMKIVEIKKH